MRCGWSVAQRLPFDVNCLPNEKHRSRQCKNEKCSACVRIRQFSTCMAAMCVGISFVFLVPKSPIPYAVGVLCAARTNEVSRKRITPHQCWTHKTGILFHFICRSTANPVEVLHECERYSLHWRQSLWIRQRFCTKCLKTRVPSISPRVFRIARMVLCIQCATENIPNAKSLHWRSDLCERMRHRWSFQVSFGLFPSFGQISVHIKPSNIRLHAFKTKLGTCSPWKSSFTRPSMWMPAGSR